MPDKVKLVSTKDYDQFVFDDKNRALNERHVRELVDSIDERNLLHIEPGVIGKGMIVIDGQHRLEAARRLEVPYWYLHDESLSIEDAPRLNQHQFNWDLNQWENFWIQSGKEDYKKLKQFREQYGLPISVSISLTYSQNAFASGKDNDTYRAGDYEYQYGEFAETIASMLDDIQNVGGENKIDFAKNTTFIKAILTAVKSGEYDHDHFMEQLRSAPYMLERQANRKQYLRNIEDLYNYKQTKTVRFY